MRVVNSEVGVSGISLFGVAVRNGAERSGGTRASGWTPITTKHVSWAWRSLCFSFKSVFFLSLRW